MSHPCRFHDLLVLPPSPNCHSALLFSLSPSSPTGSPQDSQVLWSRTVSLYNEVSLSHPQRGDQELLMPMVPSEYIWLNI